MANGSLEHFQPLAWSPSFSVGIRLFDQQHQKLVGYINDLYTAMTGHHGREAIQAILDGLIEYTLTHFIDEEIEMYRTDFPDFPRHKEAHDRFIAVVRDFYIRFRASDELSRVFCAEIYAALNAWLQDHILGMDKGYSLYLNQWGVR
ncbi:MAG: hemerythrin family protein [Nitrospinae bacterium]|nr:hemerythrin family protein [Nitrospinota bacterium]